VVALLNTFPTATLILEADGRLGFCSASASALLGLDPEASLGQDWGNLLPLDAEGLAALRTSLNCAEAERSPLTLTGHAGPREFWLECRVTDDPRDPGRRLVFLEDVTELHQLRQQLDASHFNGLIGDSEPMRALHQQIQAVARGNWTVLIEGETGVGKELVARAIHAASPRRNGPFIAVNSAGLSESLMTSQLFGHRKGAFTGAVADQKGFFEEAAGGTLFLDEIGDMPPAIQAALLRVLQENEITRVGETWSRPIDVRVIAATHRNLLTEAAAGRFREDLLYRFRVARIHVPPLRQRKTDIPQLAAHFLQLAATMAGHSLSHIAPAALQCLMAHDWPGNVRELRAAIDFAAIYGRGPRLEAGDLPPELRNIVATLPSAPVPGPADAEPGDEDQTSRIRTALKRCRDNRSEAARLLGMSRSTFYRRLRELGLEG
jgi:DNA-binding NtrC family response regulator